MSRRLCFVAAASAALTLVPVAAATAAPSVSVRVEAAKRTLLPTRTVTPPGSGSITKGGTPAGTCRSSSAAGALDAATRHHWGGTYSSGLGIEVNQILGTTLSFQKGSYWGFYVDNRYASTGVCATKLHRGEQLLFAAIPAKGAVPKPIVIKAPSKVTVDKPFTVRAFVYLGKGKATKPVSGVRIDVDGNGSGAASFGKKSRTPGVTRLTLESRAHVTLVASKRGYIRSAATTVTAAK